MELVAGDVAGMHVWFKRYASCLFGIQALWNAASAAAVNH